MILSANCLAAHEPADLSEQFIALAIQGDLREARGLFENDGAQESEADRALSARFHQRFVERSEPGPQPSGSALVDEVVTLYRDYWVDSVMRGPPQPGLDEELGRSLLETLQTLGWPGRSDPARDSPYGLLEAVLAHQQMHSYTGPAPPLQDLLIWQTQTETSYEVRLTDTVRTVTVVFMSDFHSLGWKHFATLGLASTTGWVDDGRLYCVEWAYAPDTETFDVSYLKHETRHLADLERFPELPAVDLEYRAKLTELAFANTTQRRLLDDFTAKSADNPDSPHAQANVRVTRDLWGEIYGTPFPGGDQAWMSVSRGKVSRAARRLLEQHTAELLESRPGPVAPAR